MAKPINPSSLFELPVKSFSHGMHVPAGTELLFVSGEVGARKDLSIPDSVSDQTELAFQNIGAVLADAGMGFEHVVKINGYLVDTEDYAAFSGIRDRFLEGCTAASTVVFVKALVFPQLKVEIEAVAAKST